MTRLGYEVPRLFIEEMERLEKFLKAGLNCQPGDLLIWEKDRARKKAGRGKRFFDASVSQSVSQKRKAAKTAAASLLF